ncbi:guanitoxin biosynthesis heme-dependent pre-guanitoxin N-hydroxylase GntA [Novosphingobium sp. JCM 18896]|uniref:guanitoxin biosynthesis heme-dependent pre-guanitoxin N-hydroxylase GntA n=1 Tax=Novosphingobium sp. JCM 18896 TaxID=2989731 RepID=UPI00222320AB|nr:guanitoxin biosynthesis heme-dependent pre-guanitoxin N-hydroxylase GntA [Novosphingobium sp. JCM 18896]MCW1429872.1 YqcI/YcgG family protein [Novosphingobium sp. JCM 18896]
MLVDELEDQRLKDAFEHFVRDSAFPCVGAKSALSRGTLKTVGCWSIVSGWDDVKIHRELLAWAKDYRKNPGLFRSIAFIFAGPDNLSEHDFEEALWKRVQSLADKDAWLAQPYDERVSHDPEDPHFSLSFGGEAFFVVGLHPNASRPARRFARPTLVFNLHDQFEQLRAEGRYERIRETILDRDVDLAGSINPMLARHGEVSEAAQYSGRAVEDGWRCPFRDPRSEDA